VRFQVKKWAVWIKNKGTKYVEKGKYAVDTSVSYFEMAVSAQNQYQLYTCMGEVPKTKTDSESSQ